MEDAQLSSQSKVLEDKLKSLQSNAPQWNPDNTLMTPQQRIQAISDVTGQFTSLYSHPRHAGTLMEKLRQAVHPNGAKAGENAIPSTPASAMQGFSAAPPEGYAEKQNLSNISQEGDLSREQKAKDFEATWKLMEPYIPEADREKAKQDMALKLGGIAPKEYAPRIMQVTGADGKPAYATERDGKFYGQDGAEIPDAKPYQKPPTPALKQGTAGGKNVYAQLTSEGWVDAGTKQPLHDFRPLPTYAQTGNYELVPWSNPDGTMGTDLLNRKTGTTKTISSKDGSPIAPSMMAQVNQSLEPAIAGDTRLGIMQQNEKDALAGSQQAMLSLVANHIGMTLGAQKGARINQAVWDEAVNSAPWLQNVTKKWGPDGMLQGVTLSPQQIHQMVDLAKQRRDFQWMQAKAAGEMYGVNVPMPEDLGGDKPGGVGKVIGKVGKVGGVVKGDPKVDDFLKKF
jgi:hypothetical protein